MAAIQGDWYASAGAPNEAYPERDGTVRFVYADQPNGERYIVAKVWAGDDQDYESTARLVAAAPELLAALNQVVDVLTTRMDWQSGNIPGLEDAIELATRVINKAEWRGG